MNIYLYRQRYWWSFYPFYLPWNEGEKVGAVTDFLFLIYKITAYGDCSHEIKKKKNKKKQKKKHLLLGRRATTNIDNICKSRDITLPAKVRIVHQFIERIDAFELWCWRRLLWVPWIARSINLIKKEINPEYSLKGLLLKVKLQYLGHWCRESTHWGENPYAGKD